MGGGVGATDVLLLDVKASRLRGPLYKGRGTGERGSRATPESAPEGTRVGGSGGEERLAGFRKEEVLRACIVQVYAVSVLRGG